MFHATCGLFYAATGINDCATTITIIVEYSDRDLHGSFPKTKLGVLFFFVFFLGGRALQAFKILNTFITAVMYCSVF